MCGDGIEPDRVVLDERMIEPVVLDHQVQDAVEERRVASRLDRQEQVAGPRNRRDARIHDHDLGPLLAGLPDVVRGDRRAFGDVGAADQDHVRAKDVTPGVGRAIDAERLLVARTGAHHAEPAVVVDVRGAQTHVGELAHQVGLLGGQAGAREDRERVAPVRSLYAIDLRSGPTDRVVVGHRPEAAWRAGILLVGVEQPIGMRLLQVALDAFRAHHPLVEREFVPRLHANHEVVLDLELHAALLTAEAAVRLDVRRWLDTDVQATFARVGEVRPELADRLAIE